MNALLFKQQNFPSRDSLDFTVSLLACSMEYEYLSEVPVLTIDVNEDFKGSKTRSADMIEKVSEWQLSPAEVFKLSHNSC